MTMLLPDAVKNSLLDSEFQSVYVSLHTGNPGTTGTNEVTGGGYIRQAENFSAASGGELVNAADIDFDDMPSCTVTYFGIWTASTAGTFKGGGPLAASKVIVATQTARFEAGDFVLGVSP